MKQRKILSTILIALFILSSSASVYCGEVSDDEKQTSGVNKALTGALLGGLLGGGLGAAIGSASGHAGTGAAIGAGVGAVGGTLVGASQASKDATEATPVKETSVPQNVKVKKKVVREYDETGNLISEKEVKN